MQNLFGRIVCGYKAKQFIKNVDSTVGRKGPKFREDQHRSFRA